MLLRTLALVQRALQVEIRDYRTHLFRVALPGLFIFTVMMMHLEGTSQSAAGLSLFSFLAAYDYIFITAAAATFFATAVAEEREEQTLGLLRMAGVGPVAILVGKWLPRMAAAILLLLVQLPFTLLCVTMGGILWSQIFAAFLCIVAHLCLVGSLALLCSVCNRTSSAACGWTAFLILAGHLGIWLCGSIGAWGLGLSFSPLTQALGSNRLMVILSSGFAESAWSYQVFSNLLLSAVLFGMAWLVFDRFTLHEGSESTQSLLQVLRHAGRIKGRRAWEEAPLAWHSFYYVAGGPIVLYLRLVGHIVIAIVFLLAFGGAGSIVRKDIGVAMMVWGVFGTALEGGYISSQVFRTELAGNTWSTLCLLPKSIPQIMYPRWLGAVAGILPGLTCMGLGTLLFLDELVEELDDDELWLVIFFFSALIAWAWQLCTLFSITLDWSAWPVSMLFAAMVVGMYFFCTIFCADSMRGEEVGIWFSAFVAWGLAFGTHLLIAPRLEQKVAE